MSCCPVVVTTTSDQIFDDSEMGEFHFEQKMTDFVRAEKISFSTVCLTLASMLMVYIFGIFVGFRGADIFIFLVVGSVLFIAFGGNKKIFIKQPKNLGEKWLISLREAHLSWSSPPTMVKKSNELSFEISVDAIQKIQQSYSANDEAAPYMFFLKNGDRINPGLYSAINMQELIKHIQYYDVLFERVPEFSV